MSEVLPRPTPMSFDLMNSVWSPGGSLDFACRALGVPYRLRETPGSHLVNLFGKTFVDTRIKSDMALALSGSQAKHLRKQARPTLNRLRDTVLPDFQTALSYWQATDFAALPKAELVKSIQTLRDLFVQDIYVQAEMVNILASFTMSEARDATAGDLSLRSHLMQADIPHAPANMLARCNGDLDAALTIMGHRSMFDYELSAPRYSEAPSLLSTMVFSSVESLHSNPKPPAQLPDALSEIVDLAIAFQDLKEEAKHEALRGFAELRRAIVALGAKTGMQELIFNLPLDVVLAAGDDDLPALQAQAANIQEREKLRRTCAPSEVSLSLQDIELLSLGAQLTGNDAQLGGTCVAGKDTVTGRVFRVSDDFADDGSDVDTLFDGFHDGDILVCRMIHPAWLPQVLRAGAVLSEVGGWLSHMSIVAREKNKMMLVSCKGLGGLAPGQTISVSDSGHIVPTEIEQHAAQIA